MSRTPPPRIPPAEPPYAPEVAEDLIKLMPPGVPPLALFRTAAKNPRVLRRMRKGGLLDAGALTVRERELVILRTTARCGAEYEWGVHVAFFAAAAGLTPRAIAATVRDDPAAWTSREAALLAAVDALHERATLDDAAFARLRDHFDEAQIVEICALAGNYHAVSYLCNVAGLEPEPAAARW